MRIFDEMTPGKAVVIIAGGAVMLLIWMLNNVFTFTYGYDAIGAFLLVNQVGVDSSRLLSGMVAVLFYDIAYTVGFLTLLFGCKTVWQYGVIGIQFVVCFILSIGASTISIILLSPLGADIPPEMILITRYAGYAGLVIGFIINALATVGYIATSPHMSETIRESIRNANQLARTQANNAHLDKETGRLADGLINQDIPALAQQRALMTRLNYLATLGVLDPSLLTNAPYHGANGHQQPVRMEATAGTGPLYIREADGTYTEVAPAPQRP